MKKLFNVKINTLALTMMGLFVALEIVLEFLFKIIPGQPQGGSISVALVPILLASYLMGAGYGLLVGLASTLLQFALGLATFYGPWSLVLDYLIPVTIIGLAAAFPSFRIKVSTSNTHNIIGNKNMENAHSFSFPLYIGIIIVMIIKFISHYLSGAWLFAEYAPAGQSPWLYSFGYNIVYCLPTLILCYIVFALIAPSLKNTLHFNLR